MSTTKKEAQEVPGPANGRLLHHIGELPVSFQGPDGFSVTVGPDSDFRVPDTAGMLDSFLQHGHVIDPKDPDGSKRAALKAKAADDAEQAARSRQTAQDATSSAGSAI